MCKHLQQHYTTDRSPLPLSPLLVCLLFLNIVTHISARVIHTHTTTIETSPATRACIRTTVIRTEHFHCVSLPSHHVSVETMDRTMTVLLKDVNLKLHSEDLQKMQISWQVIQRWPTELDDSSVRHEVEEILLHVARREKVTQIHPKLYFSYWSKGMEGNAASRLARLPRRR